MSSTKSTPRPPASTGGTDWTQMTPELFDAGARPVQGSLFDASPGMAAADPQGELFAADMAG